MLFKFFGDEASLLWREIISNVVEGFPLFLVSLSNFSLSLLTEKFFLIHSVGVWEDRAAY